METTIAAVDIIIIIIVSSSSSAPFPSQPLEILSYNVNNI